MIVDRKVEGGLFLENQIVRNPDALDDYASKNAEYLRKIQAYFKDLPADQRGDVVEESHGRLFLRGYPNQERLVDRDRVCCILD